MSTKEPPDVMICFVIVRIESILIKDNVCILSYIHSLDQLNGF